jgi:hypothetical protein
MVDVKYSILGVEGQHDQAFVGKFLRDLLELPIPVSSTP